MLPKGARVCRRMEPLLIGLGVIMLLRGAAISRSCENGLKLIGLSTNLPIWTGPPLVGLHHAKGAITA